MQRRLHSSRALYHLLRAALFLCALLLIALPAQAEKVTVPQKEVPASDRDKVRPTGFLNGMENNNWQKAYDLRVGNVILIRRSTADPDPAGTKVILRWRSPEEIKDINQISTKKRTTAMPQKVAKAQAPAASKSASVPAKG